MRILAAAALFLLCPLAGCVDPDPTAATPSSEPTSPATFSVQNRLPWGFVDCTEIVAEFEVESASLKQVLPEGFEPAGGLTPGRSRMGVDAFTCEAAITLGGQMPASGYSSYWAAVKAPDELVENVTGDAYVKWDALVPDAATFATLQDVGASVRMGTVKIDSLPGPSNLQRATILLEGSGTTTIYAGPGQTRGAAGQTSAGLIREFSAAKNNELVLWHANLTRSGAYTTMAPGLLDVPPGTIPAMVFGSSQIPCLVSVNTGEIRDAYIQLNARSAGRNGTV